MVSRVVEREGGELRWWLDDAKVAKE